MLRIDREPVVEFFLRTIVVDGGNNSNVCGVYLDQVGDAVLIYPSVLIDQKGVVIIFL
ncbi:hypothetical protein D3C81_880810 [compost metagenome]